MIRKIKRFLRFNRHTSNMYRKLEIAWKSHAIQKNGLSFLYIITNELNKRGLIAFADFGTLLGVVREGHLLKHDWDVDVGLIFKDSTTYSIVEEVFYSHGFVKKREFDIDGKLTEHAFVKKSVKVDIQYYYLDEPDMMYCYLHYNRDQIKVGYWQSVIKQCPVVNEVKTINVEGKTVIIPINAEQILEYKYGLNWRRPDKGWVYWEGPNTYKINDLGRLTE